MAYNGKTNWAFGDTVTETDLNRIEQGIKTLDLDKAAYTDLTGAIQAKSVDGAVRVATTANITLSGLQTIDGVTLAAGDRVLVKNQTTGSQNGIYVAASGAWARSADADTTAEVAAGITVYVREGTAGAGKTYTMSNTSAVTLGTTAITFAQSGGADAATDTIIGNRTISDTTAPTGDSGTITTLFGWLANMVKAITGKSSWRTAPAKTLEDLNNHIGSNGAAHAVATTTTAGFESAADKAKLDGIAAGANLYVHPDHTGDVTSTGDGITAIAPGVIVDADVNSAAAIAWTKISKTGSSLANLATRSAGDLSSGTLPAARLPALSGDITMAAGSSTTAITAGVIVDADISASAAIDASKIGTGTVSNTEFGYLDGVTSAIQTQLDAKLASTGNAATAAKLATARTLSLTGDGTASLSFDGSVNASAALTLAASGATAGTYKSVTVDAKGRVTAGTNPTTLAGYGITDVAAKLGTGALSTVEGYVTTASGDYSHAEGSGTTASGGSSHAEGYNTVATGSASHAEGQYSVAISSYAHAEGYSTMAVIAMASAIISSYSGKVLTVDSVTGFSVGDTIWIKRTSASSLSDVIAAIDTTNITIAVTTNTPSSTWTMLFKSQNTTASAHAEGTGTIASSIASHAEGGSTIASGQYSHAEGYQTTASGNYSHAEGYQTIASSDYSHAEGKTTTASGSYSHAEGTSTIASGTYSHTEGNLTTASGFASHAEGQNTAASNSYSHAEGQNTTASGIASHAEGYIAVSSGGYSHAEGQKTSALTTMGHAEGHFTKVNVTTTASITPTKNTDLGSSLTIVYTGHAEGFDTLVSASAGHAEGISTVASGAAGHAEGIGTAASGDYTHAEGAYCTASGGYSHAEGYSTQASGHYSHAESAYCIASGNYSHAEGYYTTASGTYSHAGGRSTVASVISSTAIGQYNKAMTGSGTSYSASNDAFVIGNGTSSSILGNAFRVTFAGAAYGLSAYNSTGADYAEMFEWADGNPNSEDRVGYLVTLDGDRISKATSEDDYVLGIVSAAPSVVGDSDIDNWRGMYLLDEWGRMQYHDITVPAELDGEGNEIMPERTETHPIYNPDWNPEEEYIPRDKRPEWSAIGLMGKLLVRDDGTCQVNGFCRSGDGGIATQSSDGYRVLKRVSPNIVQVLVLPQ